VDAGRNLTLTSEEDSDRYDSKQQSASAGGSFTFGSMTGAAKVNVTGAVGWEPGAGDKRRVGTVPGGKDTRADHGRER